MSDSIFYNFFIGVSNFIGAPWYHVLLEAILTGLIIWLVRKKKKSESSKIVLTKEEEEEIISAWKSRPLVDYEADSTINLPEEDPPIWGLVDGKAGKFLHVGGIEYLNMATHNYLGLVDDESLIGAAKDCIKKYGVGSCGPRGFYGTFDVHLELEETMAKFLKLEEAALYSYGFATISSAIPSYAKSGDIIFSDEYVNFSIQKGLQASRSEIKYFKHNNVEHFQALLEEQAAKDLQNPKKAKTQRRFCVVEGIYAKRGTVCPLDKINTLCLKYKVRLIVDESISMGVLGSTGRGITEELSIPVQDIDFISGTMEYAFASYGGFVVGSSYVVDHQRISGLGYCFSASLPPMLAGAGLHALNLLENNPQYVTELRKNCNYMHSVLKRIPGFSVEGDPSSPLKFISLSHSTGHRYYDKKVLDQVILFVKNNFKIALIQPSYIEEEEICLPEAEIRLTVNRLLTEEDMDKVGHALQSASDSFLLTSIKNINDIEENENESENSLSEGENITSEVKYAHHQEVRQKDLEEKSSESDSENENVDENKKYK